MSDSLGRRLAQAIADKDEGRLRELLADDVENPDGTYVVEQQAYYRGDGRIQHLRVLCSGFRPR